MPQDNCITVGDHPVFLGHISAFTPIILKDFGSKLEATFSVLLLGGQEIEETWEHQQDKAYKDPVRGKLIPRTELYNMFSNLTEFDVFRGRYHSLLSAWMSFHKDK